MGLIYGDYEKLAKILNMIELRGLRIGYFRYGFLFVPLHNLYLDGSVLYCSEGIVSTFLADLHRDPRVSWTDYLYVQESCMSYKLLVSHL
jgi:hypothetical protein